MTRIKFIVGLLCTAAACCSMYVLRDSLRRKREVVKANNRLDVGIVPESEIDPICGHESILMHDTVLRSLFAYDNNDHKSMVHVRFDKQTVDLLNKFKMATGVDMTKFIAFAVKYFFEANPELKTVIRKFIQNTEL